MRAEPQFVLRPMSHLHCDGCGQRVPRAQIQVVGLYLHCLKCRTEGVPEPEKRPTKRMKRKE